MALQTGSLIVGGRNKINSGAESSMLTVSKFLKFKCNNNEKAKRLHVLGGWMCGKQIWFQEFVVHIPVDGDFHQRHSSGL